MLPGAEQQDREDDKRSRCVAPESAHDTTRGFAGVADATMARRGP
jgi:glycine cleavage system protein P-like pyridoxal-binding family